MNAWFYCFHRRYYLQVNAWMMEMESTSTRAAGEDLNNKVILFVQASAFCVT